MVKALVVGGGGAKGAFSAGIIKYLWSRGVTFDLYSGTSVGSLNCLLASIGKVDLLDRIWKTITFKQVLSLNFPFITGLYNYNPIRRLFRWYVTKSELERVKDKLFVCVVSLQTKKVSYISPSNENFEDYLIASLTMPILNPPIKIGQQQYMDGGLIDNLPISPVRHADVILVLSHVYRGIYPWRSTNFISTTVRSFQIMYEQLVEADLAETVDGKIIVVEPPKEIPLRLYEFKPEKTSSVVDFGYDYAKSLELDKRIGADTV